MNINSRTSKVNFTGFASGAIASFTGLRAAPIIVRSYINAIQPGSGDPTPDNIRPISGRDSVTITANSVDHNINLDDTIYGGYLDVTTGLLMVKNQIVICDGDNSEDWIQLTETTKYYASMITSNSNKRTTEGYLTNKYVFRGNGDTNSSAVTLDKSVYMQRNYGRVWIYDSDITSIEALRTSLSLNPLQVVYPLETPFIVQLTPIDISQIIGSNSISSDSGNVEVYYVTI